MADMTWNSVTDGSSTWDVNNTNGAIKRLTPLTGWAQHYNGSDEYEQGSVALISTLPIDEQKLAIGWSNSAYVAAASYTDERMLYAGLYFNYENNYPYVVIEGLTYQVSSTELTSSSKIKLSITSSTNLLFQVAYDGVTYTDHNYSMSALTGDQRVYFNTNNPSSEPNCMVSTSAPPSSGGTILPPPIAWVNI